jgi:hypothetical protein
LRDFMLYTNDLDASRGQSIHRTDPELVELLEQAGFPLAARNGARGRGRCRR